ncbi:MAG: ABC transporter ATP-binding protein, partial [Selenomonadaceae bacterium]|nr:ABC transporter ATP-binding protein [Selenomonadaceae bacterium]
MKSILKIFKIFTPKQLRYCGLIVLAMLVGAMLEAVGIGAILPLVSIMGQPDFLERHQEIAQVLAAFGITDHITFIVVSAAGLIFVYLLKNAYMAWETKWQIDFTVKNQIEFTKEMMANYLCKPYMFHLNHNSAILMRNVGGLGTYVFSGILIPTFTLFTEIVTATFIWVMLILVDPFTAIVVAGIMGAMMYAIVKSFRRKISHYANIQKDYSVICSKNLMQSLGSIKETRVMRKEAYFLDAYSDSYEKYSDANRKYMFIAQIPRMIIETLVVSGLLLMIIAKMLMGSNP